MLSPFEVLLVLSLVLASKAHVNLHESTHFLVATVGDNITLPCSFRDNIVLGTTRHWYKQSLGIKPERISSFAKYYQIKRLYGEFNSSHRFTLDTEYESNTLIIKHVQTSDSAVYLCVHQSLHEDIEPGRSVVLNCSVQTEHCDGPLRVHWFKQSEESAAGVLYSPGGDSSDQCESNTDRPTNSCVYNLLIHNVSSEHTGTYYCAVAACGHVLFGNGTTIKIKDGVDTLIYIMSGALVLLFVLLLVLTLTLWRMKNKYSRLCAEVNSHCRTSSTTNARGQEQDVDSLHYAALNAQPLSRRQRVTVQTDCVYSSVQQG